MSQNVFRSFIPPLARAFSSAASARAAAASAPALRARGWRLLGHLVHVQDGLHPEPREDDPLRLDREEAAEGDHHEGEHAERERLPPQQRPKVSSERNAVDVSSFGGVRAPHAQKTRGRRPQQRGRGRGRGRLFKRGRSHYSEWGAPLRRESA